MPLVPVNTAKTTLFSLEVLKTWKIVTGVDESSDDRLVIAADAATAELERNLDLYFVKRSVTETLSGTGKIALALRYAPVVSIDSFTVDGNTPDPSTYFLDKDTGIVTFTSATVFANSPVIGGFNEGIKNIAITYTAGFDIQDGPSLPQDVRRAALDLTKAIYDELTTGAIAATSVSLGPSSMVIKPSKYPPSVQRVMDAWAGAAYRA